MYKFSSYTVISDNVSNNSRLLYSTRTGEYMIIKDIVLNLLKKGEFDKIDLQILTSLFEREIIVPENENEFENVLQYNQSLIKDSKVLGLVIQPTANCQLGCHYCGQVHSKKNMSKDIVNLTLNRIISKLQQKNYHGLSIKWYGGEPLLGYNQILLMSEKLINYCKEKNIKYSSSMITNGLSLNPVIFKKMIISAKVAHFQITIDGITAHDKRRITKKGGHTFHAILNNVLNVVDLPEYKDNHCAIAIRINVDKTNEHEVCPLIDRLAESKLHLKNVNIDFAALVNWGDVQCADEEGLDPSNFAQKEIDWILYCLKKGFKLTTTLPPRTPSPCMVVNPDAEVYDTDGNIYPCYEFPYTPKYEEDKYKIGNLLNEVQVSNENAITRNWYSDIKTNISTCKNCNLFPVCGGGCPKMWYNGEKGCPSFKQNIEDRLFLDYLLQTKKLELA